MDFYFLLKNMDRNIGKNISKNLSCKYNQSLLFQAKQLVTVVPIQKAAELTGDLIGIKISNKIIGTSRNVPSSTEGLEFEKNQ